MDYIDEDLSIYEGISESTLALLGLQEISYALAKHALDKRKERLKNKLSTNLVVHAKRNSINNQVNDLYDGVVDAYKTKGFNDKLPHIAKATNAVVQLSDPRSAAIRHVNIDSELEKHKSSLKDIAKEGKKAFSLHRAIERKEKRMPGWKENTKDVPLKHNEKSKIDFKIPKIGEGSKSIDELKKEGSS